MTTGSLVSLLGYKANDYSQRASWDEALSDLLAGHGANDVYSQATTVAGEA